MTDAPERIALRWQPGAAVTDGPLMDHPDYTQYIRADAVDAMLAAEREACAVIAYDFHAKAIEWAKNVRGLEQHIVDTDSSRIAAAIRKRGAK